jgi:hypothetical protein
VAFIGNSYTYFNDLPRLFKNICGEENMVEIGDCLRGGVSFRSLLKHGNGMSDKWNTPNALLEDGSFDIGALTV